MKVSSNGNIDIENHSDITVRGSLSRGIWAHTADTGSIQLVSTGDIGSQFNDGAASDSNSDAIYAQTVDGSANLVVSGDLTTRGYGAEGVSVYAAGTGSNSIKYSGGTINVGATFAQALQADSAGSSATIVADGTLLASGADKSRGIFVRTGTNLASPLVTTNGIDAEVLSKAGSVATKNGSASVIYIGNVSTYGFAAHGIRAQQSELTSSGEATVENHGAITVSGSGAANGIRAQNQGRGAATVIGSGDVATTNANNATGHGIYALAQDGAAQLRYTGNITTQGYESSGARARSMSGNVEVDYDGRIETFNDQADAVLAHSTSGGVSVKAAGELITHANKEAMGDGTGIHAYGIAALTSSGPSVAVTNDASIDINGTASASILASSMYQDGSGVGALDVTNNGNLIARGDSASGGHGGGIMTASVSGAQKIANTGSIETYGIGSRGINARASAASVMVANEGGISTREANARGIHASAGNGDTTVTNSGKIQMAGADAHGVWAEAVGGVASANNAGEVVASGSAACVVVTGDGEATVANATGASIEGGHGAGAGVRLTGVGMRLTNEGVIGALNDIAVQGPASASDAHLSIANTSDGTITGVVDASTVSASLNNDGLWSLRNFGDTDGDGVRDTLAVATSHFGDGSVVNNRGTLALVGTDTSAHMVNAGQYIPLDLSANAMALGGPVQGHLLGVSRFENSGVIDLQANSAVGDVLVVSGGQTPGQIGGGAFVSNGGTLKLDTVLNEGGAASQSDMLVVDSTEVGAGGATRLDIRNAGGGGAMTQADGIAVVEVLDKSASATDAFVLNGRTVAGAYDYFLYRGGSAATGGDVNDGNWYLRSELVPCEETSSCVVPDPEPEPVCGDCDPTPVPPTPVPPTPAPPAPAPVPVLRPEVGTYLANASAAVVMFRHTLHDCLGEVDFSERQRGEDRRKGAWRRVVRNQCDATAGNGQIDVGTDTSLLQIGADWDRWTGNDGRLVLGVMGGWGQANTHSENLLDGYRSKGRVDGYSLGVYGTWYQSPADATGLYVDTWLQYGKYHNRVDGDFLGTERYHSNTSAASIEAGWAFELGRGERSALFIEPEAQVIFTDYRSDELVEVSGTSVHSGDAGGITTRLGVRVYSRPLTMEHNRVQRLSQSSDTYELKVGAQVEMGPRWTGWGQMGLSRGDDSHAVEGLIGIKYAMARSLSFCGLDCIAFKRWITP